jgi:hypothetical protein
MKVAMTVTLPRWGHSLWLRGDVLFTPLDGCFLFVYHERGHSKLQ